MVCAYSLELKAMPVNRSSNQTPIGEPNDNLPSVRPTPSSQSGIITRGRAQVERMETDRNSTGQPAGSQVPGGSQDTSSEMNSLALTISQALGDASRRQTEALAEFSLRQTQLMNSIEIGFQRMFTQTPIQADPIPAVVTPVSQQSGESTTDLRPDRVSQIITNWKLRFNGKGLLSVDDFIYRAEALTRQTLEGNLELLARYSSNLFEGSAAEWFWRYHKGVQDLRWADLCAALRTRYKDARTDRDIQAAIDRRKQKPHESFDEFSEAIAAMADHLSCPLTDSYLMGVLRSNLLPEIQHELLHIPIQSVAELRQAVRRHENFKQQMSRMPSLNARPAVQKKTINELAEQVDSDLESEVEVVEDVAAIDVECWNCQGKGHRYHDCSAERRVFCYGCGKPDTYRPSCNKCQSSKNRKPRAPFNSARQN